MSYSFKLSFLSCFFLVLFACNTEHRGGVSGQKEVSEPSLSLASTPYLVVLGTAQDAGYPQANCKKDCCAPVWSGERARELVSCLAFVDPVSKSSWLFDATPDFKDQLQWLGAEAKVDLSGIFLTHAHIGHYTGLMHLGREVMGAQQMPVFAMPKMQDFLRNNGPWSQLVQLENIDLIDLYQDSLLQVNDHFAVRPLRVPHRDEYSETVGYSIQGPNKKALFIPDIDKWEIWEKDINALIQSHDFAFLDGSFFENGEIPGRDMSEIPHPFVSESMDRFKELSTEDRAKVHFIHFNHTNPILDPESTASNQVKENGFLIARSGMHFTL